MNETEDFSQGRKLLLAIERILAESGSLIAYGNDCLKRAGATGGSVADIRARASREVVNHYSNYTAVSGGASALPAFIPVVGTAVAVAGGAATDVGFLLKFEIEMALVLTHLHGYDIRDEAERNVAFLMAAVGTYDAKSEGNFLIDVAQVEARALWAYTPREATKILLLVLTRLALASLSKGFFRAIPLIGIALSAGINKTLTTKVGERCTRELDARARTAPPKQPAPDDVVDAHVRT